MSRPFRSLGDFQELIEDGDHLRLIAQRGTVELRAVPGALRVRLQAGRRRRMPRYHSPVVDEATLGTAALHAEPRAGGLGVRSEGVRAEVAFSPLRLSFAWSRGQPFARLTALGRRGDQVVVRGALSADSRVYGLGEKTGWLDKRPGRYRMRTTDVFLDHPAGIGASTDPLYASFPVFLVHRRRGSYGIFVDNTEFTEFDFTLAEAFEFSAPAAVLNFYVLPGPSLPEVLRQYTALTGRMPLPALWTLGYHQCRWGYQSAADVRRIAAVLRARDLPADAVWLDIDHMDGYRVFTWNRRAFQDPARLVRDLAARGLHTVTILDPGVKVDRGYAVYQEGRRLGHFLRHRDGREYHGRVWPGRSAFPDFHAERARAWWAERVRQWLADTGVAGLWIDMNEPAATDLSGPIDDAVHAGGRLPHARARNTYALEMARATFAGVRQHDPEARPFVLTRAAFSGAQAVAALWCGDNSPQWEHLAASLPMLMNLGLSGMPFVGVDIGGFAGDTHGELLARWTQVGALYPFCRNHAAVGTNAHEPWAFGPEVEAICRRYLRLRYRLLPYLYNLFYQAAQTGAPIMRPLVWHYPRDPATFNLNDQFMLGPDLLAAPVLAPGLSARAVYLPRGRWHRWGSDESLDGPAHVAVRAPLDELPLFVRAGAIIPMWPAAPHSGAVDRTGLGLHLWPGSGRLDYYEDDGATQAHARGPAGWRLTPFRVRATAEEVTVTCGRPQGAYSDTQRTHWTFALHGMQRAVAACDGQPVRLRRERHWLTFRVADDGRRHIVTLRPVS